MNCWKKEIFDLCTRTFELQNSKIRDQRDDSSLHQHEHCDALHPGHHEVGLWQGEGALSGKCIFGWKRAQLAETDYWSLIRRWCGPFSLTVTVEGAMMSWKVWQRDERWRRVFWLLIDGDRPCVFHFHRLLLLQSDGKFLPFNQTIPSSFPSTTSPFKYHSLNHLRRFTFPGKHVNKVSLGIFNPFLNIFFRIFGFVFCWKPVWIKPTRLDSMLQ